MAIIDQFNDDDLKVLAIVIQKLLAGTTYKRLDEIEKDAIEKLEVLAVERGFLHGN